MNRKILFSMALIPGVLSPGLPSAELRLNWSAPVSIPAPSGLAGLLVGADHDCLLLAGGTNFPGAMPWEGGKKKYYDDIYVLEKPAGGGYRCIAAGSRLPEALAYSASVSTPQGVVCIGGENEAGPCKSVLRMQWVSSERQVRIARLPDLPVPLANACAAFLHGKVYVAGGEILNNGVSDGFYCLENTGWKPLRPLPEPVSHAVLIAGDSCIFLAGGRKRNADGISTLFAAVYAYDPVHQQWEERHALPYALSAGTGVTVDGRLVLFGGDRGETFHQVEQLAAAIAAERDAARQQAFIREKAELQSSHPGFSRDILLYDIPKNEWTVAGAIPFPCPVTTAACWWNGKIVIPGGEIKAGVRTAQILMAEPVKNK